MRHVVATALIAVVCGAVAAAAQPGPCPDAMLRSWAEARRAMEHAAPGARGFVPFPYPEDDAAVVADFEYQVLHHPWQRRASLRETIAGFLASLARLVRGGPPDLIAERERILVDGVTEHRFVYRVVQVENWTPGRCRSAEEDRFYNVVRVFSREDGREVVRHALRQSGRFGEGGGVPRGAPPELREAFQEQVPSLEDVEARLRPVLGDAPVEARLVTVFGSSSLYCPPIAPCAALVAGGRIFLTTGRRLWDTSGEAPPVFEVRTGDRRFSNAEVGDPARRNAIMAGLDRSRECLVSLGGDGFAVARKVDLISSSE